MRPFRSCRLISHYIAVFYILSYITTLEKVKHVNYVQLSTLKQRSFAGRRISPCDTERNTSLVLGLTFRTTIICKDASGFVTGCPCHVWCSELTTYPLYVDPLFGQSILNNSWSCEFNIVENNFSLLHIYTWYKLIDDT